MLSVSGKFEVCTIFFSEKKKYYGKPRYKCFTFIKKEVEYKLL